jgi:hypothetical protein
VEATLSAWDLPRSPDLTEITDSALRGLLIPDLRLRIVSCANEHLTVEVVQGKPPSDPDALVHVEGHGPFDVLRREEGLGASVRLVLIARVVRGGAYAA